MWTEELAASFDVISQNLLEWNKGNGEKITKENLTEYSRPPCIT
jgi:hypothetical protein